MTHKEDFLRSCLVLDTETNSDDYKIAEIIESGFVVSVLGDGNWDLYQELHSPVDRPIPPKVESICYITNEMVKDKPPFKSVSSPFQEVVNSYASGYIVAHNSFYDMRVLENHNIVMEGCTWICTWRLAKKLFSSMPEIEETNLPYLRFALKLDVPIEMHCHRAGNDSFITAKLLEVFVEMMEEMGLIDKDQPYGPQIAEYAASPIIYERMPFGKHKGELMTSVPMSYWQWAMRSTDWFNENADNFDPDLAESINRALESQ